MNSLTGNSGKDGKKVMLTIGMIVKNEEKTLEECLQGLQPLRDRIPCELIITDTGSTDSTVKIAEKYADEVRHFTWCDDFAAARNTTLENIHGEWYMYLDGDEIFDETISKIAVFFETGNYKNYEVASYVQRNYDNYRHQSYNDYPAVRMRRNDEHLRFNGKIHEQLPASDLVCQIKAIAHHEGYVVLHVGNLLKSKSLRNRRLLEKELKKKDADLPRIYRHLADCYTTENMDEWEPKEQCMLKGIAAITDEDWGYYCGTLELELAVYYQRIHEEDKLNRLLESWFQKPHPLVMADCEMRFLAASQAFQYKSYEKAVENGKQFLELYRKFEAGDFGRSVNMLMFHNATEDGVNKMRAMLALCYARMGNQEEAKKEMRAANPGKTFGQGGAPILLALFCDYLKYVEDVKLFGEVYQELRQENEEYSQMLISVLLSTFPAPCQTRRLYLQWLAGKGNETDPAAALAAILMGEGKTEQKIACILGSEKAVENPAFAEVVYAALEKTYLADTVFERIHHNLAAVLLSAAARQHREFARRAYTYLQNCKESENHNVVAWRIRLAEAAIVADNDFTDEEWRGLLWEYAQRGDAYCRSLYHPDMWTEERVSELPGFHAYLFYLKLALDSQKAGDDAGYLKYLRLGLHQNDIMRDTSEYLLKAVTDQLRQEEREEKQDLDEMAQLKRQVKANILFLIQQGKQAEAAQLLAQYRLIAPDDAENAKLQKRLEDI